MMVFVGDNVKVDETLEEGLTKDMNLGTYCNREMLKKNVLTIFGCIAWNINKATRIKEDPGGFVFELNKAN